MLYPLLLLLLPPLLPAQSADTSRIAQHLRTLTKTPLARNYRELATLNQAADYLRQQLDPYADTTYFQPYSIGGDSYKNVVAVFSGASEATIVVGAHYDVCGDQEGADDNASGVVGLLELARMLAGQQRSHRIEMVAYTLEEPPYFRTANMGSNIHAQSLLDRGVPVYGMLCLEMIGYFDDAKGTQEYPLGLLSWFYGKRGDFILLVNKFNKGKFARRFSRKFRRTASIKTKSLAGPKNIPGIDYSDHLNYWSRQMSALMITDTAFYRNKNYHEVTDTMETLDLPRMAQVIDAVYEALLRL